MAYVFTEPQGPWKTRLAYDDNDVLVAKIRDYGRQARDARYQVLAENTQWSGAFGMTHCKFFDNLRSAKKFIKDGFDVQ